MHMIEGGAVEAWVGGCDADRYGRVVMQAVNNPSVFHHTPEVEELQLR
jgi:hypothetical protein